MKRWIITALRRYMQPVVKQYDLQMAPPLMCVRVCVCVMFRI